MRANLYSEYDPQSSICNIFVGGVTRDFFNKTCAEGSGFPASEKFISSKITLHLCIINQIYNVLSFCQS